MSSRPIFRIVMDIMPGYIPLRYIRDNSWNLHGDGLCAAIGAVPVAKGLSTVNINRVLLGEHRVGVGDTPISPHYPYVVQWSSPVVTKKSPRHLSAPVQALYYMR